MKNLPANLAALDREQLRQASEARDDRMSILFRLWPALSTLQLKELRKLSDERQRIARHLGILRRLHALRAPQTSPRAESMTSSARDMVEHAEWDARKWERDRDAWNLPQQPAVDDPHTSDAVRERRPPESFMDDLRPSSDANLEARPRL